MNETMTTILSRRSVRKFADKPIEKEILQDLVEAALHAPSGMGKQTWKFTVITNKDVITRLAAAISKELDRPGYDIYCPAAIFMPSNDRESAWGKEDNACAMENVFLAAASYGVGSVWINQMQTISDRPAIRAILDEIGIPENHVVYGMAALGYAHPDYRFPEMKRIGEVAFVE